MKSLHEVGIDHIEKSMMLNPGFVNLYYVHADLDCCMSLLDASKDAALDRLRDAKRRLEYGLLLDRYNKVLHQIINLFNHAVVDRGEEWMRID